MDTNRPGQTSNSPVQGTGVGTTANVTNQVGNGAGTVPQRPGIILPPPASAPVAGNAGVGAPPQQPQQQRMGAPAGPNKIQHAKPNFGSVGGGVPAAQPTTTSPMEEALRPVTRLGEDSKPLPVADGMGLATMGGKITAFGKEKRHEDSWSRSPNTTGNGAIHVKTFHCKLTDDALTYLDLAINEWLDAHPQYEVKFVSTSIGMMTGKLKEPALICQVWV